MARPTKYRPDYHPEQAYRYALQGCTGREMARLFGIAESTYELWKTKYSEFSESIKRGGVYADIQVVKRLYEKACGYKRTVQTAYTVKTGPNTQRLEVVELAVEELPDTRAIIFWLRNRQPERWGNRKMPVAQSETDHCVAALQAARARLNAM